MQLICSCDPTLQVRDRSEQGSSNRSQLAWSDNYTIYNPAVCRGLKKQMMLKMPGTKCIQNEGGIRAKMFSKHIFHQSILNFNWFGPISKFPLSLHHVFLPGQDQILVFNNFQERNMN